MKCLEIWRSGTRPGGYGLIFVSARSLVHQRAAKMFHLRWRVAIIPFPTGRASHFDVSRHFMPGYLHSIPTG